MNRSALMALALLMACGDKETPTADDTAGSDSAEPVDTVVDLPTSACAATPYDWVETDQVGAIVAVEEAPDMSFTADLLNTLLASAGIELDFSAKYDVQSWRIRYTTQSLGEVVEATGIVSLPVDPDGPVPTVLYTHGTTGMNDSCAPSGMGIEGGVGNLLFSSQGYAVASPDYLGMNGFGEPAGFLHPWLAPEPTAAASLDSLRALWALPEAVELGVTTDTVIVGPSEGGFAALWSQRYAAEVLPEAQLKGVVALVPPTDLSALAAHGLQEFGEPTGGLLAILGTQHAYYGHDDPMSDVFADDGDPYDIAGSLIDLMTEQCNAGDALSEADSVDDLFQESFISQATDLPEPWGCYLAEADLVDTQVQGGLDVPVLFQLSEADELVIAEYSRDTVLPLCDQGMVVEYVECAGADHVSGAVDTLPYAVKWAAARFAGEALATEACVVGEPVDCTGL